MEGYLSKQNRQGRWDKRWFMLNMEENKLQYYHAKPSSWRMEEKAIEAVNLTYISKVHPTSGSKNDTQFRSVYYYARS